MKILITLLLLGSLAHAADDTMGTSGNNTTTGSGTTSGSDTGKGTTRGTTGTSGVTGIGASGTPQEFHEAMSKAHSDAASCLEAGGTAATCKDQLKQRCKALGGSESQCSQMTSMNGKSAKRGKM